MEHIETKGFVNMKLDCCESFLPDAIFRICEHGWYNGVVRWYPAGNFKMAEIPGFLSLISEVRKISRYIKGSIPGVHLRISEPFDLAWLEGLPNRSLVKIITLLRSDILPKDSIGKAKNLGVVIGNTSTMGHFRIVDAAIGFVSIEILKKQIMLSGPEKTIIVSSESIEALHDFIMLERAGFTFREIITMMSENPISLLGIESETEDCSVKLNINKGVPVVKNLYLNGSLIVA